MATLYFADIYLLAIKSGKVRSWFISIRWSLTQRYKNILVII